MNNKLRQQGNKFGTGKPGYGKIKTTPVYTYDYNYSFLRKIHTNHIRTPLVKLEQMPRPLNPTDLKFIDLD